jgi:hypothetical protein
MVKRFTICILLLFTVTCWNAGLLFARNDIIVEPPFFPISPVIMAQGGSYVAVADGYNALFTNPAGFTGDKGSFTLLSANPWLYANPSRFFGALMDDPDNIGAAISREIVEGGFGIGASSGICYVGRGLGLGAVVVVDSYLYGKNLLGAVGDTHATLTVVGGYAFSLKLLGMELNLGVALRPMLRIHAPIENADALDLVSVLSGNGTLAAALNDVDVFHGMALGIDAGAIVSFGAFRLGIAARDIGGTNFIYNTSKMETILSSFGVELPKGTPVPETDFVIPMNICVGAAFSPDSGILSRFLNPAFHIELKDLTGLLEEGKSPWTLLHMGMQLRLLSFLTVRAGFNQGYLTMGGGLRLGFTDLNFALFTRELGKNISDRPSSGITAELALRF